MDCFYCFLTLTSPLFLQFCFMNIYIFFAMICFLRSMAWSIKRNYSFFTHWREWLEILTWKVWCKLSTSLHLIHCIYDSWPWQVHSLNTTALLYSTIVRDMQDVNIISIMYDFFLNNHVLFLFFRLFCGRSRLYLLAVFCLSVLLNVNFCNVN